MVALFWSQFFWLISAFDDPLVEMLQSKGWDKVHRSELRDGFQYVIRKWCSQRSPQLVWRGGKRRPQVVLTTINKGAKRCIYRKDFLRCLQFVGVDQIDAELAVKKMFELQTLEPLYYLFSND